MDEAHTTISVRKDQKEALLRYFREARPEVHLEWDYIFEAILKDLGIEMIEPTEDPNVISFDDGPVTFDGDIKPEAKEITQTNAPRETVEFD